MKKLVVLFLLIYSFTSWSCSTQSYGIEYDSLIKISHEDTNNLIRLELPRKLNKSKVAKVYLAYAKMPVGNVYGAEFMTKLKLKKSKKSLIGNYKLEEKEGYKPYIHIVWNDKNCGTVANKFIN